MAAVVAINHMCTCFGTCFDGDYVRAGGRVGVGMIYGFNLFKLVYLWGTVGR